MGPPEKETPPPSVPASEKGKRGGSSDLTKRLCRYHNSVTHTRSVMQEIGKPRADTLGLNWKNITTCGNWLSFRDYYTVGKVKLFTANFCQKHLVCSLCAGRRATKMMAAYVQRFQTIRSEVPNASPHLVTLTVRNSHNLGEVLEQLLGSLRLLHRRRNNAKQPSVMDMIDAGVYSVEVTHNLETGWHPHVHAIWLSKDPAMFDEATKFRLSTEWNQITGNSYICDIRAIQAETGLPDDIDPHAGGFAEVFKYAMKPSELGGDLMAQALPLLMKRRLVGSFGWFRGVPDPEHLGDDLEKFDLLPYFELMARYTETGYRLEALEIPEHPCTDEIPEPV